MSWSKSCKSCSWSKRQRISRFMELAHAFLKIFWLLRRISFDRLLGCLLKSLECGRSILIRKKERQRRSQMPELVKMNRSLMILLMISTMILSSLRGKKSRCSSNKQRLWKRRRSRTQVEKLNCWLQGLASAMTKKYLNWRTSKSGRWLIRALLGRSSW